MPEMTAKRSARPIDPMLVPLPIAFFVAVLGCDLIFIMGGEAGWIAATRWLLGAGLLMGFAAAVAGLTDASGKRRLTDAAVSWWHRRGSVLALVIEALNFYLRGGTAADIVMPGGLALSVTAVAILLMTGWWSCAELAGGSSPAPTDR